MFLSKDDGRATEFAKASTLVVKASPTVVAVLRPLLADVVALSIACQGAHWNVSGVEFPQYHDLFGDIYDDVSGSIDPLAENILKTGGVAPSTMSEMQSLRTTTDPVEGRDVRGLVADLAEMNDVIIEKILAAFQVASEANEQGVADFLASRDDMHKKWRWQLRTSIGQPVG